MAENPAPILPDRPSIAVLPFSIRGDEALPQYFADGMVESIIGGLARLVDAATGSQVWADRFDRRSEDIFTPTASFYRPSRLDRGSHSGLHLDGEMRNFVEMGQPPPVIGWRAQMLRLD